VMFRRHRLEKQEGKTYSDPTVSNTSSGRNMFRQLTSFTQASDEMRAASKEFGIAHSVSSILVSSA
jgi:hypothetical protein